MDTLKMKTLLLLLLSSFALYAQEEAPGNAADAADESFAEQRSALLHGKARSQWILDMKAKLPMGTNPIGPFGLFQDLDEVSKESKISKTKKPSGRDAESETMAFAETVAAIKINVINTSNGDFFIGSRKFQTGDSFPIIRNGERFEAQVVSVTESSVIFQNTKNGEQVTKKFNELPAGIRSASSARVLKGIRPYKPSNLTPLNVE